MKKLVRESLNESRIDYNKLLEETPIQSDHDDSMFCITLSDGDEACAMGDEFNPEEFDMSLEEMLRFIRDGINNFMSLPEGTIDADDLGKWSDFFSTELYDEPETEDGKRVLLTKEYVIAKMLCGIENAKSAGSYDDEDGDEDNEDSYGTDSKGEINY